MPNQAAAPGNLEIKTTKAQVPRAAATITLMELADKLVPVRRAEDRACEHQVLSAHLTRNLCLMFEEILSCGTPGTRPLHQRTSAEFMAGDGNLSFL